MASEQETRSLMVDLEQECAEEVQATVAPRWPIRRIVAGALVAACLVGVVAMVGLQQPSQMSAVPLLDMKSVINKQGGSLTEALKHLESTDMKPKCIEAIGSLEAKFTKEELSCVPDKKGNVPSDCKEKGINSLDCGKQGLKRCTAEMVMVVKAFGETSKQEHEQDMCLPKACNEDNFEKDIAKLVKMTWPSFLKDVDEDVDIDLSVDVTCD
jgi:hypothetical protein